MQSKQAQIVQSLDELIRKGEGDRVRSLLQKLSRSKIQRAHKHLIAGFARRTGMVEMCVRILNPIVYPPGGSPSNATDLEKSEYAAGLIKLGAIQEGMEILAALDPAKVPQLQTFQGIGHIAQWNYREAIPYFENAGKSSSLDSYQKLIARGNLAACYVHEGKFTEATALLQSLIQETKHLPLVHANVLKYWAELKIESEDVDAARKLLDDAEQILTQFGGRDSLLVRKWIAILDLITHKANSSSLNQIEKIQNEAKTKHHWETIRDCDYYKAIYTRNQNILLKLYFGTPYSNYRDRVLRRWKSPLNIPDTYSWALKGKNKEALTILLGEKAPSGTALKVGQMLHRNLLALASDFYRPYTIASLHSILCPEERFNPNTSVRKVHFWTEQLRKWFKDNKVPLNINVKSKTFQLVPTGNCSLLVPRIGILKSNTEDHQLQRLQKKFPGDFSVSEASEFLGVSIRSALAYLSKGVQEHTLNRLGKGRGTRYRFVNGDSQKEAA